jgi:glycosyltransferase involved in cell wall biosynthesis
MTAGGTDPRPDVSVIIPTRNRPQRLDLSLRSSLAQRDIRLEVIVVDDASSVDVLPVVEGLADGRVRLVRNADPRGESGTRNRGIHEASGRWLAFLDDDDLWAPDKLTRQLDVLHATGRVWAYGGVVTIDDGLNVLSGSPPPTPEEVASAITRHNAVPGSASSVIVAADVVAQVGPFDPTLRRTPDWDMWLRLSRVGLPACVEKPVVAITVHPGNASRDMDALFRELPIIAARHGIAVDRARHHRWAAWLSSIDGRRADALRHYAHAVRAGDVASVARALATLAPRRIRSGRLARPVGSWAEEARDWLEPIKRSLDPEGPA